MHFITPEIREQLIKDGWIERYNLEDGKYQLYNFRIGNCSFAVIEMMNQLTIEIYSFEVEDVLITRYYKGEENSVLDFIRFQKKDLYEYYSNFIKDRKKDMIEDL
jgi:hypothetical protein